MHGAVTATLVVASVNAAMIATMVTIVRDVFASLVEEDREVFRAFAKGRAIRIEGPIDRAWDAHIRLFPHSRKRLLFGFLFGAALLSILCYPVFDFLGLRRGTAAQRAIVHEGSHVSDDLAFVRSWDLGSMSFDAAKIPPGTRRSSAPINLKREWIQPRRIPCEVRSQRKPRVASTRSSATRAASTSSKV